MVASPISATALDSVFTAALAKGVPAIVQRMNRDSDNFTAEMLLKQLGLNELYRGTSAAGAAVVMQTLTAAGVPGSGALDRGAHSTAPKRMRGLSSE